MLKQGQLHVPTPPHRSGTLDRRRPTKPREATQTSLTSNARNRLLVSRSQASVSSGGDTGAAAADASGAAAAAASGAAAAAASSGASGKRRR